MVRAQRGTRVRVSCGGGRCRCRSACRCGGGSCRGRRGGRGQRGVRGGGRRLGGDGPARQGQAQREPRHPRQRSAQARHHSFTSAISFTRSWYLPSLSSVKSSAMLDSSSSSSRVQSSFFSGTSTTKRDSCQVENWGFFVSWRSTAMPITC